MTPQDSSPPVPIHGDPELQNRILAERVKELNCLYSISKLIGKRDLHLDDILQAAVIILPSAWQYPESATAQIQLRGRRFHTPDFAATPWSQECPIIAHGQPVGNVEICYLEEQPARDEGPFIQEERNLLNVVAQLLGEIVERKWAEERLLSYQKQLQSLASQLSRSEAEERHRLARDLHDRIGQNLAILQIKVGMLKNESPPGAQLGALEELQTLLSRTIQDTRTLMFEISPPVLYEFGLGAALEWLIEKIQRQFGLAVELIVHGQPRPLGEELRVVLFRAARELLANVVKHARTQTARVILDWTGERLCMRVEDNGAGFNVEEVRDRATESGYFGLFSIKERFEQLGGQIQVVSAPGHGTQVTIELAMEGCAPPGGESQ